MATSPENGKSKKREANIELLRLLAMAMVVSLHYLSKGELLADATKPMDATGITSWLLESFSIAAVNTYVLISGYFMVHSSFKPMRLVKLWLQVLFYTILTPVVLGLLGFVDLSQYSTYDFLRNLLPVNMLQYWFISAYFLMVLVSPLLNAAVKNLPQKELGLILLLLLGMESLTKTVIPVRLELDNLGYDCFWFMVVYLIGAYIRLYGLPFIEKWKSGPLFGLYACTCLLLMGLYQVIHGIYLKNGSLEHMLGTTYGYNHLLVILAAVLLFATFRKMQLRGGVGNFIIKISPYTLGVYLLHEQLAMRYLWPKWLFCEKVTGPGTLVLYWAIAIVVVMAAGLLVDALRALVFEKVEVLGKRLLKK